MIFVDTNAFAYLATQPDGSEHLDELGEAMLAGSIDATTSVLVLEELLHLELSGRVARPGGLAESAHDLVAPVLGVSDHTWRIARSLEAAGLGAADRFHVATCRQHGITEILTADRGFDAVDGLRRIDPLDEVAIAELLDR